MIAETAHAHTQTKEKPSIWSGRQPCGPSGCWTVCLTPAPEALTWLKDCCQINSLYPIKLQSWQAWTCSSVLFHVLFQLVLVGLCERLSNLQHFSLFHHIRMISPLAKSLILQMSGVSLYKFDKGIFSLAAVLSATCVNLIRNT